MLCRKVLLTDFVSDMAQASAAANRILSFRVKHRTASKTPLEIQETEGGVKIELRDLWFKYPTRDIPIFTGLNLTVMYYFIYNCTALMMA
jgi:ATP-binding cassette, subfamily B (MDR/TAP), member 1